MMTQLKSTSNKEAGTRQVKPSATSIRNAEPEGQLRTELFDIITKIIHTPNIVLKVYLFIFTLAASGMASYTVIQVFMSYFAYGVTTTTRTLFETPTLFPKVTICNVNWLTTEYAYNFLNEIDETLSTLETNFADLSFNDSATLVNNIWSNTNNANYSEKTLKSLGHNLEDLLLSCSFNGVKCTADDFIWFFDVVYGNCYVFNLGFNRTGNPVKLKESSIAGSYYGLQLGMYTNFYENLTVINSFEGGRGLIIRIDNSSYLTDHKEDGIKISAGLQTDIVVERSFKFMLPSPYSNCKVNSDTSTTEGSDIFVLIAQSAYEYSQQLCFVQCYQQMVIRDCHCKDVYISLLNSSFCASVEETKCMNDVFDKKFLANLENNCAPRCPLECNLTEYKTALTSYSLLGDFLAKIIRENPNLSADFVTKPINSDTALESVASVNLFYGSLSYTISTESPQLDIIGLLASIGGNLGLFLGVSLLSVCEIFEVLIEICFRKKTAKIFIQ